MILTDICCFNFVRIEYFHLSEQEPGNILVRLRNISNELNNWSKSYLLRQIHSLEEKLFGWFLENLGGCFASLAMTVAIFRFSFYPVQQP